MTRIDNATTQNLSDLVKSLNTNTAQELRSKGTDLYVKEKQATFTSVSSRTTHRQDAIALVRDSLAREYNLTSSDADKIMKNVFGGTPTKITAGDANRLHQLGQVASQLGGDKVQAFENARQLESLQGLGLSKEQAEWALPKAQEHMKGGMNESEALHAATTSAGHFKGLQDKGLSKEDAEWALPRMEKSLTEGTSKKDALQAAVTSAGHFKELQGKGLSKEDAEWALPRMEKHISLGLDKDAALKAATDSAGHFKELQGKGLSKEEAEWALPRMENHITQGKSKEDALQAATTSAGHFKELQGKGLSKEDAEWALPRMEKHVADGKSKEDALTAATTTLANFKSLQNAGMSKTDAEKVLPEMDRMVSSGRSKEDVATGIKTAGDLVAGRITTKDAGTALKTPGAKDTVVDMLKSTMGQLPRLEDSSTAEKTQWGNLASACGSLLPVDKMTDLTPSQKASVLDILSARAKKAVDDNNIPAQKECFTAVMRFNQALKLTDVYPPSEKTKVDNFLKKASEDPTIKNAEKNWSTLTVEQRKTAISTMVRLHSEEFNYTVPNNYLAFVEDEPDICGGLNLTGTKLEINTKESSFLNDFQELFDTVAHESTHKYQIQMMADFRAGTIPKTDARYDQARLFVANDKQDVFDDDLIALGFSKSVADSGYRGAPVELHAYHVGNYAGDQSTKIFT